MIRLARHIEILLLGNECVIVPDFGGFVAHRQSARYDESEGLFLPPLRTLGFNPQLKMNDSLLAQSYVEAYDLSYPEAVDEIAGEVDELRKILETTGCYEFANLGKLYCDKDGKLNFEPFDGGILTPEFYAFSSFQMPVLKADSNSDKDNEFDGESAHHHAKTIFIGSEDGQQTLNISLRAIRNVSVAAVFLVAAFLISFPIITGRQGLPVANNESGFYEMFNPRQQAAMEKAEKTVKIAKNDKKTYAPIKPAISNTKVSDNKANINKVVVNAKADNANKDIDTNSNPWSIVICSHVSKKNAEALAGKLKTDGLKDVYVSTKGANKVLYGHYASKTDAHEKLNTLNDKAEFKDAWILENK